MQIRDQLLDWLPPEGAAWTRERCAELAGGAPERKLFLSFSAAPRKTGRTPLAVDPAVAERLRPGWGPSRWTADQAARAALVLSWPSDDAAAYVATLDKVFAAADLGELVALYQALPLLPHPEAHRKRAAEGLRSNMTAVFRAVAHGNPFPREQFSEEAWNQMVLKALFVGVELAPILGLDERANPALMRMLCDYAHERWAAGRAVSPELWRCVGQYADEAAIADLNRVLAEGDEAERAAAEAALRHTQ